MKKIVIFIYMIIICDFLFAQPVNVTVAPPIVTSPSCFRYKIDVRLTSLDLKIDDNDGSDKNPEISFKILSAKLKKVNGELIDISYNCITDCWENNNFNFYLMPFNVNTSHICFPFSINTYSRAEFKGENSSNSKQPVFQFEQSSDVVSPADIDKIIIKFQFIEVDVPDKACELYGCYKNAFGNCKANKGKNDYNLVKEIVIDFDNGVPGKPRTALITKAPGFQYLEDCDIYDYLNIGEKQYPFYTENDGITPLYNHYYNVNNLNAREYIKVNTITSFSCYTPSIGVAGCSGENGTQLDDGEYLPGHFGGICAPDNNSLNITCLAPKVFSLYRRTGNPDIYSNDIDLSTNFYGYTGDIPAPQMVNTYNNTAHLDNTSEVYKRKNNSTSWVSLGEINRETGNQALLNVNDIYDASNYLTDNYGYKYTKYEYTYISKYVGCTSDNYVTNNTLAANSLTVHAYPTLQFDKFMPKLPCLSNFPNNQLGSVDVYVLGGTKTLNKCEILSAYKFKPTGFTNWDYEKAELFTPIGENIETYLNDLNQQGFIADFNNINSTYLQPNNISATLNIPLAAHPTINQKTDGSFTIKDLPYGIYKVRLYFDDYWHSACDDQIKWLCIYPASNPILTIDKEAFICDPNNLYEINAAANREVQWLWNGRDFTSISGHAPGSPSPLLDNNYAEFSTNEINLVNNSLPSGCTFITGIDRNGCASTKEIEIPNFNPPAYQDKKIDHVLGISASRLEGTWLSDFRDLSFIGIDPQGDYNKLFNKNPYESAQAGLYRSVSSFDYLSQRQQKGFYNSGSNNNLAEDGIYNDPQAAGSSTTINSTTAVPNQLIVPLFNWSHPKFEKDHPKWIKNGTITKYSSNTEEIENKDILGNYSTALYGYRSTLPIAVASNARNNEIAFESFEEYEDGNVINQVNNTTGNFDIVNSVIPITLKKYDKFIINNASGRYAITNIDATQPPYNNPVDFANLKLKVLAKAPSISTSNVNIQYEENLVSTSGEILQNICIQPGYEFQGTLVKFEEGIPGFNTFNSSNVSDPYGLYKCNRFWTGELYVEKDDIVTDNVSYPKLVFTNEQAHTGNISLKIENNNNTAIDLKQYSLDLKSGTSYLLSGWIKTDQSFNMSPTDLTKYSETYSKGITLKAIYINGSVGEIINATNAVLNGLIVAKGPIIDGWQKFEYKFTYPTDAKRLVISFNNKNSAPFYLDDIRLCPYNGNIQTYVYEKATYRQEAILDQNNFATIYKYDEEGKLFQIKKETEEGIKTIQVTQSFIQPNK